MITYLIKFVFNCYLSYSLKLGRNFILSYDGLVLVIHEHTIIGDDCHIDQNINIGGALKLYDVLSGSLVVGIEAKVIKY